MCQGKGRLIQGFSQEVDWWGDFKQYTIVSLLFSGKFCGEQGFDGGGQSCDRGDPAVTKENPAIYRGLCQEIYDMDISLKDTHQPFLLFLYLLVLCFSS